MKIIYTSDLHGNVKKFDRLYDVACRHQADIVINGGDMYPMDDLYQQDRFINGPLTAHFKKFHHAGIRYLSFPGNDDLAIFDSLFNALCDRFDVVFNIAQRMVEIEGWTFVGMNFVNDYPFQLKDRCRLDRKNSPVGRQLGPGMVSQPGKKTKIINDWATHIRGLPTIEEELERLIAMTTTHSRDQSLSEKMARTIYVVHNPPAGLGLDVCGHGEAVGSQALHDFLKEYQPLMSLHGHIHESFDCTGIWRASVGKTIAIQPGQSSPDQLTYAVIEIDTMMMERMSVPLNGHG